jgi:(p)ppGpp synthase/HD superfamily hydrolase
MSEFKGEVFEMIKNREKMPWHKIPVFKFAKENNLKKTMLALHCVKDWFFSIKRKDDRWEFIHPYRVAQILIFHEVVDDDILAATILHDTLENISFELEKSILCLFGERVALIVW